MPFPTLEKVKNDFYLKKPPLGPLILPLEPQLLNLGCFLFSFTTVSAAKPKPFFSSAPLWNFGDPNCPPTHLDLDSRLQAIKCYVVLLFFYSIVSHMITCNGLFMFMVYEM